MSPQQTSLAAFYFGPFEVDLQTQELKKQGVRLRLPGQSLQILLMLLQRPGQLVPREELQQALWPSDTFVDFEKGLNAAINRLREYAQPFGEPLSECAILELLVQGHPVRLIVDTGFPGLLLFQERLKKHIPTLRTEGRSTAVSIGGRLKAKQVLLQDVVFGARNGEVSVLLVEASPPDTLPGIDGVVGLTPLKAHRVRFDFVGKRVSWE
jgi:predicted aspartyl protease